MNILKGLMGLFILCNVSNSLGQCSTPSLLTGGIADETNSNRYHIDGEVYDNPMTMFDRRKMGSAGQSVNDAVEAIRNVISNDEDLNDIYRQIVVNASLPEPNDDGSGHDKVSALARWAKNNAFVYLIGLNTSGQYLDAVDLSLATRRQFRTNALAAFQELTDKLPDRVLIES